MGLIAKKTGGAAHSPLDAGTYPARCVGLVDLGLQSVVYKGKENLKEQVRIIWELPTERTDVDGVSKPRWMSKTYTVSLHDRSVLRKDLESWRSQAFTEEELNGFSLRAILGAPCLLTIIQAISQDGYVYSKIGAISPPTKGMSVAPLEGEPFAFDMDDAKAESVLSALPEWMQEQVRRSPTWQAKMDAEKEEMAGFQSIDDDEDGDLPF